MRFHERIDLGESADRAGNRAGGDLLTRSHEPFARARELGVGVGKLKPERSRLGMDTVRAADRRRHLVLEGAAFERGEQGVGVGDQDIGGTHQLHVEAGVEHVRGSHAGMHEAGFRPDDFGKMRQESDDVVLDLGLDCLDASDVELGGFALGPDFLGGVLRDDAEFAHGLGGVRLDLKPDAESRFRRPDRDHVGAGIAGNRHAASPRASAAALRMASILLL